MLFIKNHVVGGDINFPAILGIELIGIETWCSKSPPAIGAIY